jgi:hypothetical protein
VLIKEDRVAVRIFHDEACGPGIMADGTGSHTHRIDHIRLSTFTMHRDSGSRQHVRSPFPLIVERCRQNRGTGRRLEYQSQVPGLQAVRIAVRRQPNSDVRQVCQFWSHRGQCVLQAVEVHTCPGRDFREAGWGNQGLVNMAGPHNPIGRIAKRFTRKRRLCPTALGTQPEGYRVRYPHGVEGQVALEKTNDTFCCLHELCTRRRIGRDTGSRRGVRSGVAGLIGRAGAERCGQSYAQGGYPGQRNTARVTQGGLSARSSDTVTKR